MPFLITKTIDRKQLIWFCFSFYSLENWICLIHRHRNHVGMASIQIVYSENVFSMEIHDEMTDVADVDVCCVVAYSDARYLLMPLMFLVYP